MRAMKRLFARALKDERGGEVIEYAVIAGLIVVVTIAVVTAIGPKVAARWTTLDKALTPSTATPTSATGSRTAPPPVSPAQ